MKKVRVDHSSLEMGASRVRLKEEVKTAFLKGFKSRNIQHPLFDSVRTEAKRLMITKRGLQELKTYDRKLYRLTSRYVDERLMITKRGLQELKTYDRKLYRLTSRYVDENKLTASEFGTRTGYTPAQLFERFTGGDRRDWEKRYRVNETKTQFEPLEDTRIKMRLLRKSNANSKQQKLLLTRVKNRTKDANKQHAWKTSLRKGDRVFLTHSRLKGSPSEKPLKVFEKRSTQTKSEWNTSRPYEIDTVYNATKSTSPARYRIRNANAKCEMRMHKTKEEPIEVAKSVIRTGQKCEKAGVNNVFISAIIERSNMALIKEIREVNGILKTMCKVNNFYFIDNNKITKEFLSYDNLHLNIEGTRILANNYIYYLNKHIC